VERAAGPDAIEECGTNGFGFAIHPPNIILAEGVAAG
jgi:hypothetical protein